MKKSLFILSNLFLALLFFGCGSRDKDAKKWIPETAEYVVCYDLANLPEIAPFKDEVKAFKKFFKKQYGDEILDCRVIIFGLVSGKAKNQWQAFLIQSKNGQVGKLFDAIPKMKAFRKLAKNDDVTKKESKYGKGMYVIDKDEGIDFTITLIDKNLAVVVIGEDKDDIGFLKSKKACALVEDANMEDFALFAAFSKKFVKAAKKGKVGFELGLLNKLPAGIPGNVAAKYEKTICTLAVAKGNKAVWNIKAFLEGEKTATEYTLPLSVYDKEEDDEEDGDGGIVIREASAPAKKSAPAAKPASKDDDDDDDDEE